MFNKWEFNQQSCVPTDQLKKFPFNCIGYFKTIAKVQNNPQSKMGTGFLVSRYLVLTSANFFIGQSKKTQIEQLAPISFTLIDRKMPKRQYKIEAFRVNSQFIKISKEICKLNEFIQKQTNSAKKNKLREQIVALTQDRIKHDFALMKINERIRRDEVFKLMHTIEDPSSLTITGQSLNLKKEFLLKTQSRKIEKIKDRIIFYDEVTGKELSGSPVYIQQQDNKVIGIHSGNNITNCATMITYQCVDILQQWSIQMKAPFQVINRKKNMDANEKKYINEQCWKEKDRRIQVKAPHTNKFPYDCIGWLDGTNRFDAAITGTGFLISPCFVLTSAHTIHSIIDRNKFKKIPLKFSMVMLEKQIQITDYRINLKFMDLQNQKANIERILAEIKDKQEQIQCRKQIIKIFQQQFPYDYALLKLEQKVNRPQYFCMHTNFKESQDVEYAVTGYNDHDFSFKLRTHSGLIDDIRKGAMFYDIDTQIGQSGSPVYIKQKPNIVVGIHKAGSRQDKKNFATIITKEMTIELKKWSIEMNPYFQVISKSKQQKD